MKITLLTILLIVLSGREVLAQEARQPRESQLRRWSVSYSLAGTFLGPAGDIENAMRRDGFARTGNSFFGRTTVYPLTNGAPSWMVNVKYYFKSPFALSVLLGNTNFGYTAGYAGGFLTLSIENSAFVIAPVVSINEYDVLRIGIGPSLYFISVNDEERDPQNSTYSQTKIGFMLDIGLRITGLAGFFADLTVQYRRVGNVEIGPFTAEFLDNSAVLSKASINFDHSLIGVGIGRRF